MPKSYNGNIQLENLVELLDKKKSDFYGSPFTRLLVYSFTRLLFNVFGIFGQKVKVNELNKKNSDFYGSPITRLLV